MSVLQSISSLLFGAGSSSSSSSSEDSVAAAVPAFTCKDEPIENQRPLKVRVIGAGFAGVYLGIRMPQRLRNVDLKIYEKNEGVGGTWWENRYPGCACDIPAHSYQYSFAPNKRWSSFYAPAEEIGQYIHNVAEKYGALRFIQMQHEVTGCRWDDDLSKWHITVKNLVTGESFTEEADVVVAARGNLNQFKWPDIPGFESFKGGKIHSAKWDPSYDFTNKRIGVIGNGSSSIQIVPQLQKIQGTDLTCFVRSETWISNRFGDFIMNTMGWDPNNLEISEEQIKKFEEDDEAYLKFRKIIEDDGNFVHESGIRGTNMQKLFIESFDKATREKLASRPDLLRFFVPKFSLGCRRLTPGPGYLEALMQDNARITDTHIASVDETGINLVDGTHVDLDVIVCATGFDTTAVPPFEVVGRGGSTLAKRFKPFPETYLSIAMDGFPNYWVVSGPNSGIGAGSLTVMIEGQSDYIVQCVRKLQKEDYLWMVPKAERVKDYAQYVAEYFKKTVYMEDCRSWYKTSGNGETRVTALYPGSLLHAREMYRSPRWEDYEYGTAEHNHLRWLGNGWSHCLIDGRGDPSFYLNPDVVDVPVEGTPEKDPRLAARAFSH